MSELAHGKRVLEHIERGLERYSRGELLAAIAEWEAALRLDPTNPRAHQYIQYVRENFELLAAQFGRVVDGGGAAAGAGAIKPLAASIGAGRATLPPLEPIVHATTTTQGEALAAMASGWDLEEFVPDALPPPPADSPVPPGIDVAAPSEREWAGSPDTGDDLAALAQAVVDPFGVALTPPHGLEALEPMTELPATRRREPVRETAESGSMEALAGLPLGATRVEGLEPGLDPERTRPDLSGPRPDERTTPRGLPVTREPEELTRDLRVELHPATAVPAVPGTGSAAPGTALAPGPWAPRASDEPGFAPAVEPVAPETDFSGLLDEINASPATPLAAPPAETTASPPEELVAAGVALEEPAQPAAPARPIHEGEHGELIVEIEAEPPDGFPSSSAGEFVVDLGSLEAEASRVARERAEATPRPMAAALDDEDLIITGTFAGPPQTNALASSSAVGAALVPPGLGVPTPVPPGLGVPTPLPPGLGVPTPVPPGLGMPTPVPPGLGVPTPHPPTGEIAAPLRPAAPHLPATLVLVAETPPPPTAPAASRAELYIEDSPTNNQRRYFEERHGVIEHEIRDDPSPPPHEPPVITLIPREESGGTTSPDRLRLGAATDPGAGSADPSALAGWSLQPADASALPGAPATSAQGSFEHEYTPLPAPYDPEQADDEFDDHHGQQATARHVAPDLGSADLPIGDRVTTYLTQARASFEQGALEDAFLAANAAFACDPRNEASAVRESERQLLIRIFEAQLGSLKRKPQIAMSPDEIARLGLDHRFGFMLSLIDGCTSYEDLLDIAGMPRLEAFRILNALLQKLVIVG
jgi:hypothetical protein